MIKNIIIEGGYNSQDGSIDINEEIEDKLGSNWEKKWEISGSNILRLDRVKKQALVRLSLSKQGDDEV